MMKTTEEMIEVMQAFARGEPIEALERGNDRWFTARAPTWNWFGFDYRIAPKPELTQDVIPWDAIGTDRNWSARDASGDICVYATSPVRHASEWNGMGAVRISRFLAGVTPGTVDWRDSLQQRPAAEEKRP